MIFLRDNRRDCGRGLRHLVVQAEQGLLARGCWDQFQGDFGNDPQHPLGADKEVFERESGYVFDTFVAGLQDLTVG